MKSSALLVRCQGALRNAIESLSSPKLPLEEKVDAAVTTSSQDSDLLAKGPIWSAENNATKSRLCGGVREAFPPALTPGLGYPDATLGVLKPNQITTDNGRPVEATGRVIGDVRDFRLAFDALETQLRPCNDLCRGKEQVIFFRRPYSE
ncbi:hypothetical protein PG994_000888 [Apiospora phragmitis]|uniref:Uncharacterized protein n=1 Tax=Apiospora phragmitis TaxID=2905665 RepID=A0ABR1WQV2_9PEZI